MLHPFVKLAFQSVKNNEKVYRCDDRDWRLFELPWNIVDFAQLLVNYPTKIMFKIFCI